MNTRRCATRRVEEAAAKRIKAPPHTPTTAEQVFVNPEGLTDCHESNALLQNEHAIKTQAQAITAQAAREGGTRENPHASTVASRQRDITRMNPPV